MPEDSGKQNTTGLSSDVFSTSYLSFDTIVISDEQKSVDNPDIVSLVWRALNKLANSGEYTGIVKDTHAFVNVFNEKTPEYELCLGPQAILYKAEKQKSRG